MEEALFQVELRDFHDGGVGEEDRLLLEVMFDGQPVASMTLHWHGDLELEIKTTKYFGGKTPGITTALELHRRVLSALTEKLVDGESDFASAFNDTHAIDLGPTGEASRKLNLPPAAP